MIDQRDIFIAMIFLFGACTFFVGYVWGKLRAAPDPTPTWYAPGEDFHGEPVQDFDGGYALNNEPRRLTRLTSRETTTEY